MKSNKILIDVVTNYVANLDKMDKVIVIEAPTGYGKSVSAPILAALNYEKEFSYNFLHVLPLRAIVEDLYICKYLSAVKTSNIPSECRAPPEVLRHALKNMGIDENDIAYQMGFDYMIKGIGLKRPTYDAKIVISTLDSFAYTFLRVPVTEIFREVKHYATPRARIFTSSIFLDEAHMLKRFDDESSEKMLTFLKTLIEFCLETSTPLVMATATLWEAFRKTLINWANGKIVFFTLSNKDEKTNSTIYVKDKDFENFAKSIKWHTDIIEENYLIPKIIEHVEKNEKILVVRDTIDSAIHTYNQIALKHGEKVLIHGRLCLKDREEAIEKSRKAKVVIATPIIEAGVDWDFDVGFRDATNVQSIVQVFGRVCRSRENCEGHVYLIKTENSIKELIEYINTNKKIDWKLPYTYTINKVEFKGYNEILNITNIPLSVNQEIEKDFKALISPLALPSIYINKALRKYAYSFFKEPLSQFYIYGYDSLKSSKNIDDIISSTFNYTLDLVVKYRKCIEASAYAVKKEENNDIIVEKIEIAEHNVRNYYIKLYNECIRKSASIGGELIFCGFVIKRECYIDKIGLT